MTSTFLLCMYSVHCSFRFINVCTICILPYEIYRGIYLYGSHEHYCWVIAPFLYVNSWRPRSTLYITQLEQMALSLTCELRSLPYYLFHNRNLRSKSRCTICIISFYQCRIFCELYIVQENYIYVHVCSKPRVLFKKPPPSPPSLINISVKMLILVTNIKKIHNHIVLYHT